MARHALFSGLISDENDAPVETELVGNETFYVVNDNGFRRYISSETVDRQILNAFTSEIEGREDFLSEQVANMMGKDDIFSVAIMKNQLQNIDQQIDAIFETGVPEEVRAYLGLMGFSIKINFHGDILEVNAPSRTESE